MPTSRALELFVWLLIAASLIAVIAARTKVPYTVALVIGGLIIGSLHRFSLVSNLTRAVRPEWFTPDVVLFLFLPPLLFEASINLPLAHLRDNLFPILLLASVGVLAATVITGFAVHWAFGIPVIVALVFGAIISATDPISVISVFREMGVSRRLSMILEAESLFNDGTAIVLFGILTAGIGSQHLGIWKGVAEFLVTVIGAALLGAVMGYLFTTAIERLHEPRMDLMLTTILAYGSYLAAQSLHLSGVIATVAAGIVIGNWGAHVGTTPNRRAVVRSFWDFTAFVINSLLFLLIGIRVEVGHLLHAWEATLIAVAATLFGRALSVYGLTPISNVFAARIPPRWQHLLVWGGLRGAIALALVLSLQDPFPYRADLLTWTFGVVAFSIIVQGLTIKPLITALRLEAK
ncbi:MAG: cation:proton antiporter [Terriglobia bacterium]